MATRLYLRNTTANTTGYVAGEKSVALPSGTNNSGGTKQDMQITKGAAQTNDLLGNSSSTAHFDHSSLRFFSDLILAGSIDANTWTVAAALSESNTNLNYQVCLSLYVLKSDDTVRAFVYDSHTLLGVEPGTTELGQVFTISGAAVAGVASTDRLVLEVWAHMQSSMATSYTSSFYYNGATDVTTSTTADAASYIETPQDLFTAPPTQAPPRTQLVVTQAVQRAANW